MKLATVSFLNAVRDPASTRNKRNYFTAPDYVIDANETTITIKKGTLEYHTLWHNVVDYTLETKLTSVKA